MHQLNLARIDLNLLVVFDAVARRRSVTLAAESLALSQPAVSHALRRLRDLMRDPLFVRSADGLVLTPRAQACLPQVRSILADIEGVLVGDMFDPATTTRTFRLAGSDYTMLTVVPAVVARLRRDAPGARIDVSHVGIDLFDRMAAGDVDLGFFGSGLMPGRYRTRELFRERFVGLICRNHPLGPKAERGAITLADYLAHPHVVVTFRNALPSPVDDALDRLGHQRRIAMVTPNFAANIASLPGTDLIMSAPSRLATGADAERFVRFDLPIDAPAYAYLMGWHERTEQDPALAWLRGLIGDAAGAGS
jgi:DNA-binding transcriptional LysR family regulator